MVKTMFYSSEGSYLPNIRLVIGKVSDSDARRRAFSELASYIHFNFGSSTLSDTVDLLSDSWCEEYFQAQITGVHPLILLKAQELFQIAAAKDSSTTVADQVEIGTYDIMSLFANMVSFVTKNNQFDDKELAESLNKIFMCSKNSHLFYTVALIVQTLFTPIKKNKIIDGSHVRFFVSEPVPVGEVIMIGSPQNSRKCHFLSCMSPHKAEDVPNALLTYKVIKVIYRLQDKATLYQMPLRFSIVCASKPLATESTPERVICGDPLKRSAGESAHEEPMSKKSKSSSEVYSPGLGISASIERLGEIVLTGKLTRDHAIVKSELNDITAVQESINNSTLQNLETSLGISERIDWVRNLIQHAHREEALLLELKDHLEYEELVEKLKNYSK